MEPAKTPRVGPVAAHRIKRPFTKARGACSVTSMYEVPQYCTPVTVKYSAAIAGHEKSTTKKK